MGSGKLMDNTKIFGHPNPMVEILVDPRTAMISRMY